MGCIGGGGESRRSRPSRSIRLRAESICRLNCATAPKGRIRRRRAAGIFRARTQGARRTLRVLPQPPRAPPPRTIPILRAGRGIFRAASADWVCAAGLPSAVSTYILHWRRKMCASSASERMYFDSLRRSREVASLSRYADTSSSNFSLDILI